MTPNFERAFTALRSQGACISIEKLAQAITHAEADVGRELRSDEMIKLARDVHAATTGEHIGDLARLDLGGAR